MALRRLFAPACLIALACGTALAWASSSARADGTGGKVAGMVMSNLGQSEAPATAMNAVAADGVNTVSLFVWWLAQQPSSDTLSPFDATESDASLAADIASAHAAGLKVVLTPIFICEACEGGWRGVMQPANVPAFFASYRAFMDHYAQLAQADGVWLLFVGSEMTSLEGQTAQWLSVISSARQYYTGQIGYEQNWDVVGQPQFLSAVDVVGVSAYYPLDDSADPSESQLMADWTDSQNATYKGHNWVGGLQHLASSTGKPILFGEVGYMASDYAASHPFDNNYIDDNPTLQANLYQALLSTFSGYSWWMGVTWWEWSDTAGDGRTPRGRPAETLLRDWYLNGWRPSTAPTPSAGSPTAPAGTAGAGAGANGAGTGAAGATPPGPAGTGGTGTAGAGASGPAAGMTAPESPGVPPGVAGPGGSAPAAAVGGAGRGSGPGGTTTTSPTVSPRGPYPIAGSPQAAGPAGRGRMVLTDGGGRSSVLAAGAVALVGLAGTAAAVPVVGFGPQLAARRRRPARYADFD